MTSNALLLVSAILAVAYGEGPCDILDAAKEGTPCVAAHSTVRALYAKYDGPLYQVRRMSDNTTQDIKVLAAGGFADSKSQDSFCGSAHCVIWRIYDQTTSKNRKFVYLSCLISGCM